MPPPFARPSGARLVWALLAGGALLPGLGAPALTAATASQGDAEGLWEGVIIAKPGEVEVEVVVELARDPQGALVGTLDMPSHGLSYAPLEEARQEGSAVSFAFSRYSATAQLTLRSTFQGELAAGGQKLEGTLFEGDRNRFPFLLQRLGAAGSERRQRPTSPVVTLSDAGEELKAAFNRDRDKLRLLFLVSPTCSVCLMHSRMLDRHLLEPIADERLRVYLVWGPMQHKETVEDAERATATMHDPRVTHFWTDDHGLAEAFQGPLGITGEPAWDSYMLFVPGAKWEGGAPHPAFFMVVEKPLAPELHLNVLTFAEEVRRRLGAG